ncbi:serine hydrolase [Synechocystis sp. CS-94]|nr:serine hydrolase [Synechocystis sp. CS-94]
MGTVLWGESVWFSHPPLRPREQTSVKEYLVNRLNQAKGKALGSAALALIRNGKVETIQTFGVQEFDPDSPVNPQKTLYQMASVIKLVPTWGVMIGFIGKLVS